MKRSARINDDMLTDDIRLLASQINAVRESARAAGVFVDDRELLECPRCGLLEDVLSGGGRLITCRDIGGDDTRLRFTSVAEGKFRCPACDATVREPRTKER